MVPLRVLFLCTLVIVLCSIHDSDAWRRRFRFRAPRIRLPRIRVPRIRVPRIRLPRIRIPLPRIRVRRVLDKIKGTWDDIRESVSSIKDKIKYVIACKQVSKLKIVDKCKGEQDDTSGSSDNAIDYCRNITAPAAWGAPSLSSRPAMVKPVSTIALYIAEEDCVTADCKLQAISEHTEAENYNFIVDGHGATYEGRGWNTQSDHHALAINKQTQYGVVLIATNDADFSLALTDLIYCGITVGAIRENFDFETGLIINF